MNFRGAKGRVDLFGIFYKAFFSAKIKALLHQPSHREVKWFANSHTELPAGPGLQAHGPEGLLPQDAHSILPSAPLLWREALPLLFPSEVKDASS